jgi:nucleoid-associated protein YgaU
MRYRKGVVKMGNDMSDLYRAIRADPAEDAFGSATFHWVQRKENSKVLGTALNYAERAVDFAAKNSGYERKIPKYRNLLGDIYMDMGMTQEAYHQYSLASADGDLRSKFMNFWDPYRNDSRRKAKGLRRSHGFQEYTRAHEEPARKASITEAAASEIALKKRRYGRRTGIAALAFSAAAALFVSVGNVAPQKPQAQVYALPSPAPVVEAAPVETKKDFDTYIVREKGIGLWKVARELLGPDATDYEVFHKVKQIKYANGLEGENPVISINDELAIPAEGRQFYKVRKGDSLSEIALDAYGNADFWPGIYEANKTSIGDNPDVLEWGKILEIPDIKKAGKNWKSYSSGLSSARTARENRWDRRLAEASGDMPIIEQLAYQNKSAREAAEEIKQATGFSISQSTIYRMRKSRSTV